jgi:hypothetical protein
MKHTCAVCKLEFTSPRNKRKYCSLRCRNKGYVGRIRPEWEKRKISETMKKYVRTEEHQRNNSAAYPRGERHPLWKGGKRIGPKGYIYLLANDHPFANKGYVFEHRLVMEKHLGRYLQPEEVVHHIDEDITNNTLNNLQLFKNGGAHTAHHAQLKRLKRKASDE